MWEASYDFLVLHDQVRVVLHFPSGTRDVSEEVGANFCTNRLGDPSESGSGYLSKLGTHSLKKNETSNFSRRGVEGGGKVELPFLGDVPF